ncbi:DEAD/DEAH box helicase [Tropicimonas sp. IMCC34043]|uniref:DEAD/DEAH box helicase n=1 Tax=Tropicimonas sp. IMCC34043 TaxID=2248760 RepID=UPI000E229643|nr:DEAD/DEAH box helicase [Tropicimonas sp. IMCC34043]
MITTLSDALAERGFDTLTDVQTAVTAPELADADLLVSAQTGSGKTVGFGLAIAQTLLGEAERFGPPAAPLALIVAPTRELAQQVQREIAWLYGKAGARVVSCIGGMDARDERRALERGAHIVVGTPGRLRDHITRGALDLADIRAVVLDEADEMLDLGFREDLEFMLAEAPEGRRTLLFSATVPAAIAALAKTYQRNAVRVTTLTGVAQHADIAYQVVQVAPADAEHAIINLLRYHDAPAALVFANTRAAVSRLTARFANRGLSVVSLSGELSQEERSHALQALRDGRARVCVATDVAARGIDLPNLELVIHADLPTNTEGLLHRSGRTGRAGRKGISALIVPDKITNKASRLLKWAKIEAEWISAPSAEEILARDEERLLADPAWEMELTGSEAGFAATLMARYTPEQIAAACLRLHRAHLSAPEELNTREARAPREERAAFGPSAWVALSVGRDKGAEARWLLPLLCRTANLEKAQIGKIRVLDDETYVEITEASLPGVIETVGDGGVLEEDVHLRVTSADALPDAVLQSRPERPQSRGPRPERPARTPRHDTAAPDAPRAERPASSDAPRPERPAPRAPRPERPYDKGPRPERSADKGPRTERPYDKASRPERSFDKGPRTERPYDKGPRSDRPYDKGPRPERPASKGPRPEFKRPARSEAAGHEGPRSSATGAEGRPDKPTRKPFKTQGSDAPRKPFGKPRRDDGDDRTAKPRAHGFAKPAKPGKSHPFAADTSKRLAAPDSKKGPGKAKPRSKPNRTGGDAPPRRKV